MIQIYKYILTHPPPPPPKKKKAKTKTISSEAADEHSPSVKGLPNFTSVFRQVAAGLVKYVTSKTRIVRIQHDVKVLKFRFFNLKNE